MKQHTHAQLFLCKPCLREGERRGPLRAARIIAGFNRGIGALAHPAVNLIRAEAKKLRERRQK